MQIVSRNIVCNVGWRVNLTVSLSLTKRPKLGNFKGNGTSDSDGRTQMLSDHAGQDRIRNRVGRETMLGQPRMVQSRGIRKNASEARQLLRTANRRRVPTAACRPTYLHRRLSSDEAGTVSEIWWDTPAVRTEWQKASANIQLRPHPAKTTNDWTTLLTEIMGRYF